MRKSVHMESLRNVRLIPLFVVFFIILVIPVTVVVLQQQQTLQQHAQTSLPAIPSRWPYSNLQLGFFDGVGGAAAMKAKAPYGFRYAYLSGGAGTGWSTWNPNGGFASGWIEDSMKNGITPAFIYYNILQSGSGCNGCDEQSTDYNHLQNVTIMTAWYNDFKLLMQKAAATPNTPVLVDAEPDFWGFMQQKAKNDDATTVPAVVSSTGLSDLAGLPNNLSGFAQAIIKLRDTYAPNVILSYELSIWGTGNDIVYTDPDNATVTSLAQRSANFYNSLHANFDLTSTDPTDRDAAFKQFQYNDGGAAWWTDADYNRDILYLSTFIQGTQKRMYLWQIPFGNTKMKAENNTWDHYQDNHVEYFLDDPTRAHLQSYVNAGVIALLFGRGADGVSGNCDCSGDGVTNPAPINGNTVDSYNADDDGGFFEVKSKAYYATGPLPLSIGTVSNAPTSTPTPTIPAGSTPTALPSATPIFTPTPTLRPTATPTPLPTSTPTIAPTQPLPTDTSGSIILGNTKAGSFVDSSDSNFMNGSRFTMGSVTKNVVTMSVHVGNVSAAPNNQFQVAIYSDNNGNPAQLLARSQTSVLSPNAWNTIAISATLQAKRNYWFMYNTNGTSPAVNNMNLTSSGSYRMAWSTNGTTFGFWPTIFGAVSRQQGVFSMYVTLQ